MAAIPPSAMTVPPDQAVAPASAAIGEVDAADDQPEEPIQTAVKTAPPWLISMIFHTALLLVLAMLFVPDEVIKKPLQLQAVEVDENEEEFFDDFGAVTLPLAGVTDTDVLEQVITPVDLAPVPDPFAAPKELDLTLDDLLASSDISAPQIGLALTGREPGMKQALLVGYGGTEGTERAVLLALEWLSRQQRRDGSWSLVGPYSDGGAQ